MIFFPLLNSYGTYISCYQFVSYLLPSLSFELKRYVYYLLSPMCGFFPPIEYKLIEGRVISLYSA